MAAVSTAPAAPKNSAGKPPAHEPAEQAASAPKGGAGSVLKGWLPLILAAVAMPALAYLTSTLVLVPKLQKAVRPGGAAAAESEGHAGAKEGKAGEHPDGKVNVPFGKVLVNISGTLGMRYLLTSLTLVGADPEFRGRIEQNRDRLMDLASSTLSTKTIADLEKPGARNLLRSELISVFNSALGQGCVQEIYFTEFAVQ